MWRKLKTSIPVETTRLKNTMLYKTRTNLMLCHGEVAVIIGVGLQVLLVVRTLRAVPLSVLGVVHILLVVAPLRQAKFQ